MCTGLSGRAGRDAGRRRPAEVNAYRAVLCAGAQQRVERDLAIRVVRHDKGINYRNNLALACYSRVPPTRRLICSAARVCCCAGALLLVFAIVCECERGTESANYVGRRVSMASPGPYLERKSLLREPRAEQAAQKRLLAMRGGELAVRGAKCAARLTACAIVSIWWLGIGVLLVFSTSALLEHQPSSLSSAPADANSSARFPRVVLCLFGVLPRGIGVTWPVFRSRVVDVLRARQVPVEVALFGIDVGSERVNGVTVDARDTAAVPHVYNETTSQPTIDARVKTWCTPPACQLFGRWSTAARANAWRQLFIERRVGQFLKQNRARFDVAIVACADLYLTHDVRLADVVRAAGTADAIFTPNFRDHGGGFTDSYYIGRPDVIGTVLCRLNDVKSAPLSEVPSGAAYELLLKAAFHKHGVSRIVTAQQFFKVRANRRVGWGGTHRIDWSSTEREGAGWLGRAVEKLRIQLEYVGLIWRLRAEYPLRNYVANGDLARTLWLRSDGQFN